MQVSARTLTILKNFIEINPGIIFKPGTTIRTCNDNGPDMFAIATVSDNIEKQFAVADLSQFIAIMSSFTTPIITLNEKTMTISQDNREVLYTYSEPSLIFRNPPPDDDIVMPDTLVASFKLSEDDLTALSRMAHVLRSPNISIVGENGNLSMRGQNVKDPTGNVYAQQLGKCDSNFSVSFLSEKINILLNMDYDVSVARGIVHFAGKDVSYFLGPLAGSSTYE